MVLEVVSESSLEKDTEELPPLYQQANILEFWRIDVRHQLVFQIFQLTEVGYVPTQEGPDGWWRSHVFDRWFRMTQQTNPLGQPQFILEMRP
jgi:Uma2 family endonuclease